MGFDGKAGGVKLQGHSWRC